MFHGRLVGGFPLQWVLDVVGSSTGAPIPRNGLSTAEIWALCAPGAICGVFETAWLPRHLKREIQALQRIWCSPLGPAGGWRDG
jgi:hypothetical protein